MLIALYAALALATDPIAATTASTFSWTALSAAKAPIAVATFTQGKVTYDLKCDPTSCTIDHGTTHLSAHVTITVVKGTQPTVNVVIDGTDAGYLFSKVAVRWIAPAPAKGTVVRLGGYEVQ